jgi:hypothetical protein
MSEGMAGPTGRNGILDGGRVMTRDAYAASIGHTADGKPLSVTARFDQGTWWRTKDDRWLRIADMDETHRYNTAAMLMRHAGRHAFAYSLGWDITVAEHDGGDMAHESLERIADEIRDQIRDPQEWLRGTALYRALTAGFPTKRKALKRLAERAGHWSTCPKRTDLSAKTCTCPRPVFMDSSCGCSGEAHA